MNGSFRKTKIYAGSIRFTHILKSVKTWGTQIYRSVNNFVNKKLFTAGRQRIFVHVSKREVTKTLKIISRRFLKFALGQSGDRSWSGPSGFLQSNKLVNKIISLFEIHLLFVIMILHESDYVFSELAFGGLSFDANCRDICSQLVHNSISSMFRQPC